MGYFDGLYENKKNNSSLTSQSTGGYFSNLFNNDSYIKKKAPESIITPTVQQPKRNKLQEIGDTISNIPILGGIFQAGKEIAKSIPEIPKYLQSAVSNPFELGAGAGESIVSFGGSLAGIIEKGFVDSINKPLIGVGNIGVLKPDVKIPERFDFQKQAQALKEWDDQTLENMGMDKQKAFETGRFLGSIIPYSLSGEVAGATGIAEAGVSKFLPQATKFIPAINNAMGFLGISQLEYNPGDGSRVDQLKNDLTMLALFEIGGVVIKGISKTTKGLISKTVNETKTKLDSNEAVPLNEVEIQVNNIKSRIEQDTGEKAEKITADYLATEEPGVEMYSVASSGESVGAFSKTSKNSEKGLSPAETNLPSFKTSNLGKSSFTGDMRKTSPSNRTSFVSKFSIKLPTQEDYNIYFKDMQNQERTLIKGLQKVVSETNGEVAYRLKTQSSLQEKLNRKERTGKTLADMNDTLGSTIVVKSPEEIYSALESAKKHLNITKIDDFRSSPTFLGYKSIHLDTELPNGGIAEVQLNTKSGLYQKEYAHTIYDKWRKYIEKNKDATLDSVRALIKKKEPKRLKEFNQDIKLSNDIYSGKVEIPQEYINKVDLRLASTKVKMDEISSNEAKKIEEATSEVKDAIKSGDEKGAREFYKILSEEMDLPSFEVLKREVNQENIINARMEERDFSDTKRTVAKEERSLYSKTQIEDINRLKSIAKSKDFQEGDIETLRKKNPELVERVIESVREIKGENMSDTKALDIALNLPTTTEISKGLPLAPKEVGVSREQLPVGTGKEKASRLEARMTESMKNITPENKEKLGLTTFNMMNKKETIKKASKFVSENPDDVIAILKGEKEAPKDIPVNALYVALHNMADLNEDLAIKLTSLRSTRMGQEISILSELDPNSPVKIMNDIIRIREEAVKKRYRGKSVDQVTNDLEKNAKRQIKAPSRYDWSEFINSIQC